jgi:hypothetical protein
VPIQIITNIGIHVAGLSTMFAARKDVMKPAIHSKGFAPAKVQSSFNPGMTSPLSMIIYLDL